MVKSSLRRSVMSAPEESRTETSIRTRLTLIANRGCPAGLSACGARGGGCCGFAGLNCALAADVSRSARLKSVLARDIGRCTGEERAIPLALDPLGSIAENFLLPDRYFALQ